ncbi:AfsR/SARP family transcriptional regulator [Streptomyces sp. NBC_01198]|uniref:AfsR/SARP family transcriptional regulator n=1 Tax=Streptomyces sp. NBC_01198 TaxID=2903769 RepID=UPI002E0D2331|nr:AfsR/SARP family transcriptional regulator [Streptomyces sp. NBC_01198]
MRFEMLGSLRAVTGEGPESVSAPKVETLLSVLLIRAGQVTSTTRLADEIWGDRPPRRFTAAVHVYVYQVRKSLASWSGSAEDEDERLTTRPGGYVLRVDPGELDVVDFRELAADGWAHAAARRHEAASRSFARALSLWRGPVLDGLGGGPIVEEFVRWAEEARLECEELRIEQELALGRYERLITPLRALTAEHPLREGFARQLMLALHLAGRSSEALTTYREVSRTIDRELGLEPGRGLRELYATVRDGDQPLAPVA